MEIDLSDDDLFPLSDDEDETNKCFSACNPVEEHLLKQMRDATERVEKAKSNVQQMREMTEKVLKKLRLRETCSLSSESDTADSDNCYEVTGEPVMKKKRVKENKQEEFLKIVKTWQQVIDDKWIIGVVLTNTSNRILVNPRFYAIVNDQTEIRGISSFWEILDSVSTRTDELNPEVDKLVACAALDLPNFSNNAVFEASATISYTIDEKDLQIIAPNFRLRAKDVTDKTFAPKFSIDFENTVLAIKSISIHRELVLPIDKEDIGARLFDFLEQNGFKNFGDDKPDVYVAKSNEFCRHCIFEILTIVDTKAPIRITARTSSHLEVIIRLLRDKFADVRVTEVEDRTMEAAKALEHELELELAGVDPGALHIARILTDLLIP